MSYEEYHRNTYDKGEQHERSLECMRYRNEGDMDGWIMFKINIQSKDTLLLGIIEDAITRAVKGSEASGKIHSRNNILLEEWGSAPRLQIRAGLQKDGKNADSEQFQVENF